MRLYDWHKGVVTPGIAIRCSRPYPGRELTLGLPDRGIRTVSVRLDKHNPPEERDGKVHEAALTCAEVKGRLRWYFVEHVDPADAFVVRISTQWRRVSGQFGACQSVRGSAHHIVTANGPLARESRKSRTPRWTDSLYVLRPGDKVLILPEGFTRTGLWAVENRNGVLYNSLVIASNAKAFEEAVPHVVPPPTPSPLLTYRRVRSYVTA